MIKRIFIIIVILLSGKNLFAQITTGTLLEEMIDMNRLTLKDKYPYKTVQYSSYDRRSLSPDAPNWFGNADGFGGEEIPAFESILKEPDENGIGEYLICDVEGPGAIVRLWTAAIDGNIRMYLDGKEIYNGNARDFLWNFPIMLASYKQDDYHGTLRQFDAFYFPIPFKKRCRIEWIGSLNKTHFYHVGIRLYDKGVNIKTFQKSDLETYKPQLEKVMAVMKNPDKQIPITEAKQASITVPVGVRKNLIYIEGSKAIDHLAIKVAPSQLEQVMRQTILRIFFDGAATPQIEAPIGDFFGAAPGINPFVSLPFTVKQDGTMICRFVMPFKQNALIQIENMSPIPVEIESKISVKDYNWEEGRSMYLRAHWRVDHGIKAGTEVRDVPYLLAMGKGRVVGAACYLMNPSNIPTAGGNWWGEGDEKIFVDNDKFPSFFGTGSEDYFNYSWSIEDIFYYPYCGQPRDDGPCTRGFITNFRWHIIDDIPFYDKLAFYLELLPHNVVSNFSYARMVYLYGESGMIDDHYSITPDMVRPIKMPIWNPISSGAATDYRFLSAEQTLREGSPISFEYDPLWAGGNLMLWTPSKKGEKLVMAVNTSAGRKNMQFTFALLENGGEIKVYINGQHVRLRGQEVIDLNVSGRKLNRSFATEDIDFKQGENIIIIENVSEGTVKIGVDLLWIRD